MKEVMTSILIYKIKQNNCFDKKQNTVIIDNIVEFQFNSTIFGLK